MGRRLIKATSLEGLTLFKMGWRSCMVTEWGQGQGEHGQKAGVASMVGNLCQGCSRSSCPVEWWGEGGSEWLGGEVEYTRTAWGGEEEVSVFFFYVGWHLFSHSQPSKEPKDGWVYSKRICDQDQSDHGSPDFCDGGIGNAWRSENVQVSPSLLVIFDELIYSHILQVWEQAHVRW